MQVKVTQTARPCHKPIKIVNGSLPDKKWKVAEPGLLLKNYKNTCGVCKFKTDCDWLDYDQEKGMTCLWCMRWNTVKNNKRHFGAVTICLSVQYKVQVSGLSKLCLFWLSDQRALWQWFTSFNNSELTLNFTGFEMNLIKHKSI